MPDQHKRPASDGSARILRVEQLVDAFGDPMRHAIYLHLRERGTPVPVSEVVETFGLHRTAARAQLEKLRGLDLVSATSHAGPSPGRPCTTYAVVDSRLEFTMPSRRYRELSQLLIDLLLATLPTERLTERATAVGRAHGEQLAAELAGDGVLGPVRLSLPTLAAWMNRSGYEATIVSSDGSEASIEVHNCVYEGLTRERHEVACAFDRGMLCGMLGVDSTSHRQMRAIRDGDSSCRHAFRL